MKWPPGTKKLDVHRLRDRSRALPQRPGGTRFAYVLSEYCQPGADVYPVLRCGGERLFVFLMDVRTPLNHMFVFLIFRTAV